MEALADLRLQFDANPGEGPLMANCFWHEDDNASMAIYEDHVYCFGCPPGTGYRWPDQLMAELARPDGRGGIGDVRRSTRGRKREKHLNYLPTSMATTYHEWLMDDEKFGMRREWLHARGLRDDVLIANQIGHCGNAFTIPVFLTDDELVAIRYRRDDLWAESRVPKYWGTWGKNAVQLYAPRVPEDVEYRMLGTVLITEGELDALRLAQEGYGAISLTNGAGSMTPELADDLATWGTKIRLVYDQDMAGQKGAVRALAMLARDDLDVGMVVWPPIFGKDVTDFLQRWPVNAFQTWVNRCQASS